MGQSVIVLDADRVVGDPLAQTVSVAVTPNVPADQSAVVTVATPLAPVNADPTGVPPMVTSTMDPGVAPLIDTTNSFPIPTGEGTETLRPPDGGVVVGGGVVVDGEVVVEPGGVVVGGVVVGGVVVGGGVLPTVSEPVPTCVVGLPFTH
jgi:hypothetical protein